MVNSPFFLVVAVGVWCIHSPQLLLKYIIIRVRVRVQHIHPRLDTFDTQMCVRGGKEVREKKKTKGIYIETLEHCLHSGTNDHKEGNVRHL